MDFLRGTLAPIAGALVALADAAGCGDDDGSSPACTPGESVACVGAGGCSGGQACPPDGTGFGPCDCGSEDAGAADDAGSADAGAADSGAVDAGSDDGGLDGSVAGRRATGSGRLRSGGQHGVPRGGEVLLPPGLGIQRHGRHHLPPGGHGGGGRSL